MLNQEVLLIYPPSWIRVQPQPPLGISTIAAALRALGIVAHQVDLEVASYLDNKMFESPDDKSDLGALSDLARVDDWVMDHAAEGTIEHSAVLMADRYRLDGFGYYGFSAMSHRQFASAVALAHICKDRNPGCYVGIGGQFAIANAVGISTRYPVFDHVFADSDYLSAAEVIAAAMKGLAGRSNSAPERVIRAVKEVPIEQMPVPVVEESALDLYERAQRAIYGLTSDTPILKYLVMTGCPFRCVYCSRHELEPYALKSAEKVGRELAEMKCQYDSRLFSLEANEINPSWRWLDALVGHLERKRLGLEWYGYAVPRGFTPERAALLRESGCRVLRFGVESGSSRLLRTMNKRFSPDDVDRAIRTCAEAGIWSHVNLIVGFPGETDDDIRLTLDLIERLGEWIDSARINPFYLHSATELYREYARGGMLRKMDDLDVVRWEHDDSETWD